MNNYIASGNETPNIASPGHAKKIKIRSCIVQHKIGYFQSCVSLDILYHSGAKGMNLQTPLTNATVINLEFSSKLENSLKCICV